MPESEATKLPSQRRAGDLPAHLQHAEGKFKNARGQQLSYVGVFPARTTRLRGLVVWLHGIGEHARRYFHLYERLCALGFGVAAYDLLSHGESDSCEHGLRAHSSRFQYFVDDTNEFVRLAREELLPRFAGADQRPPLVLGGMSYGTLVSLHTVLAAAHDFRALFLVAPAVSVEMTPTLRVQAAFSKPLSAVLPKARIVPGVNRDFVSRDAAFLADFEADPLTSSEPITARMAEQSLRAMLAIQSDRRVEDPKSAFCAIPVLFLMGSGDKVTSVPIARAFYERIASADKQFTLLDGFFHDLFNDPEREKAFSVLSEWLALRFPASEELAADGVAAPAAPAAEAPAVEAPAVEAPAVEAPAVGV